MSIYDEPAVVRRIKRRGALARVTSNSALAALAMVVASLLALVVANSPAYEAVEAFLGLSLSVGVGGFEVSLSVESFVNDGLMTVFFLLVGIELKYEMTVGQLCHPRQAALPMLAAVGGVTAPALIYLAMNWGSATASGWAVPIATDIAFALGIANLLGDRIKPSAKVFFQTLAIADDILAIVVIALFYGQVPDPAWCAASGVVVCLLALLNRARVYSLRPYVALGVALWVCMYNSGIHATLAGVILAFALPARSDVRLEAIGGWLAAQARDLADAYDDEQHVLGQHDFTESSLQVERVVHHVTPPLQRMEGYISTFSNFVVLPLFAFVNARLHLVGSDFGAILGSSVAQGAYFGAVCGKPIGIILVTYILVKTGFAKLPRGMDWRQVAAVGILGGMGFTMSILISGLAFTSASDVVAAKCAILAGSVSAAVLGSIFTRAVVRDKSTGHLSHS